MYSLGINNYGQLGIDSDSKTPIHIDSIKEFIVDIHCGFYHTIVLSSLL